ncbi:MAG: coenzyme F420-0:L-glutamate ligase [Candidatus Bathyarchaeota archaeon]|nr:MAG: coenzyme F420-0:L-glutamate ligase [Candidatus Bathyarchaeota archaeon]
MSHYKFLAIKSKFWKPKEDYIAKIVTALKDKVQDGDFIVISEKAISTATGNIYDESKILPNRTARFLAKYWMRYFWPYVLGPLCHLRGKTIQHLRNYPIEEGSAHKQVALQRVGLLQALRHASEGGIDATNLPYSYVSLPLKHPLQVAKRIRESIRTMLRKEVVVMIVDTDKTYTWKCFHFSSRSKAIDGIRSFGGFIAYLIGRSFKLEKRATPLVILGTNISVEETLEIAEMANRARGHGMGRTIWDIAAAFNVKPTGVSWKMLEAAEHKPIVIIRSFS